MVVGQDGKIGVIVQLPAEGVTKVDHVHVTILPHFMGVQTVQKMVRQALNPSDAIKTNAKVRMIDGTMRISFEIET